MTLNSEGKMDARNRFAALILGFLLTFFGLGAPSHAQHQHGQGAPAGKTPAAKETPGSRSGGQTATVEGFKITFEVMSMAEHMKHLKSAQGHGEGEHSQSHSFMVSVQDTASKEIISDAKVQYIATAPSGAKETGALKWSGDHYGGGFNPKEKGKYQITIKIESGGMTREAKFQYPK
jgi:hypothetical protein